MPLALFDTSVYITALRRGDLSLLSLRRLASDTPLCMSAVVLEELYAGADQSSRPLVEKLERDFDRANRMLVPNLSDWVQAGSILFRLAETYDYEQIGRGRLSSDALIAMSAARKGIRILTSNGKDFGKLAEFRSFQWQLIAV